MVIFGAGCGFARLPISSDRASEERAGLGPGLELAAPGLRSPCTSAGDTSEPEPSFGTSTRLAARTVGLCAPSVAGASLLAESPATEMKDASIERGRKARKQVRRPSHSPEPSSSGGVLLNTLCLRARVDSRTELFSLRWENTCAEPCTGEVAPSIGRTVPARSLPPSAAVSLSLQQGIGRGNSHSSNGALGLVGLVWWLPRGTASSSPRELPLA